jgi:L-iditol 2-dehydrogenase
MKCLAWYGKGDVRLEERPIPAPESGEVLVKVAYCGVCGTDMHAIDGVAVSAGYREGLVLGHEYSGVVVDVGEGVTSFRKGDLVLGAGGMSCGRCLECREGRSFRCENGQRAKQGAWAEYVSMPEGFLHRIPFGVSLPVASLAEPLSNVANTVAISNVRLGETALVIGGGTIGSLMVKVLSLRGAHPVILSEPDPVKRQLAVQNGATLTLDPTSENVPNEILAATKGSGADLIIDAVGAPATIQDSINSARRGGRIILHGVTPPGTQMSIEPYVFFSKLLHIQGVTGLLWSTGLELLKRLELDSFLSEPFSLDSYEGAFAYQRKGGVIKVLFAPNGHPFSA